MIEIIITMLLTVASICACTALTLYSKKRKGERARESSVRIARQVREMLDKTAIDKARAKHGNIAGLPANRVLREIEYIVPDYDIDISEAYSIPKITKKNLSTILLIGAAALLFGIIIKK